MDSDARPLTAPPPAASHLAAWFDRPPTRDLSRRLDEAQARYIDAVVDDHGPAARAQAAAEALALQGHGEQIARLARQIARDFAGAEALIDPARPVDAAALAAQLVEALDLNGFTADAQNVMRAAANTV